MPVYSMTGYAAGQGSSAAPPPSAEARSPTGSWLGIEIRSVNSRFLDLSFRLPEELRQFEPKLRDMLSAQLKRGKVEVRATVESGSATLVVEPSARLLQRLGSVQDNIKAWLPDVQPLGVADVLRLASTEQSGPRDWGPELATLAEKILRELLQARKREGAKLATALTGKIEDIRALTRQATPLIPKLVAAQRQRFLERWNEAMAATQGTSPSAPEAAQDRALSEATAFAIRIDVAEEITRLDAHLDEIERLIGKGGEIGKRLDFLIQELHREANTLGSKSAALELTHVSVDMKVLIEQMREQVQNIE
jgi:uncharacterized protein (TIGR00255 family)